MLINRKDRGAAAVEFALLMPFLMLLLLGIIEFAFLFLTQATVANAARMGVRNYVINYADPNAEQLAINAAAAATPDPSHFVSGTFSAECTPMGKTTFTLVYRHDTLTGFFDGMLGAQVNLIGVGSMQCGG